MQYIDTCIIYRASYLVYFKAMICNILVSRSLIYHLAHVHHAGGSYFLLLH